MGSNFLLFLAGVTMLPIPGIAGEEDVPGVAGEEDVPGVADEGEVPSVAVILSEGTNLNEDTTVGGDMMCLALINASIAS